MASICTQCGYEGRAKKTPRGSRAMEIFVWTMLFLPGPLYSLWRRVGLRGRCPNCGNISMVRTGSAQGKLALRRFEVAYETKKEEEQAITSPMVSTQSAEQPSQPKAPPRTPVDPEAW